MKIFKNKLFIIPLILFLFVLTLYLLNLWHGRDLYLGLFTPLAGLFGLFYWESLKHDRDELKNINSVKVEITQTGIVTVTNSGEMPAEIIAISSCANELKRKDIKYLKSNFEMMISDLQSSEIDQSSVLSKDEVLTAPVMQTETGTIENVQLKILVVEVVYRSNNTSIRQRVFFIRLQNPEEYGIEFEKGKIVLSDEYENERTKMRNIKTNFPDNGSHDHQYRIIKVTREVL